MNCPHCDKKIVIVCGESSIERWGIEYKSATDSALCRAVYFVGGKEEGLKWFKEIHPEMEVVECWRELVVR